VKLKTNHMPEYINTSLQSEFKRTAGKCNFELNLKYLKRFLYKKKKKKKGKCLKIDQKYKRKIMF